MNRSTLVGAVLCAVLWAAGRLAAQEATGGPLPDITVLRERALANFKKTSDAREKYTCRERIQTEELNGKGGVKKTEVLEREAFFVHGHEISQTLTRDGKPLSPGEQKKQEESVRKAIEVYSSAKGEGSKKQGVINLSDVLKKAKLSNERRVTVNGRPTILFDAAGDPQAKAADMAERFLLAMEGTVAIDEQTGVPQDISLHGVRDVKMGGGLVANVHKGFYVHGRLAPQPDGVWLLQQIEGNGDARVGLFFHPSVRFQQATEGCKLYSVTTDSVEKVKGHP